MGIFLFWFSYIIAGIFLYNILFNIYTKTVARKTSHYGYSSSEYEITENDKKLKHPLWLVIVFCIVFLIPIVNIFVFAGYLAGKSCDDKYYVKSVFTKEI